MDKILRAFYNVYNTLCIGFLEKVYELDERLKAVGKCEINDRT
jgi:hypothetical protein